MNISSNNMRGLSQYSLLNKLFSQKNGKKFSMELTATEKLGIIETEYSIPIDGKIREGACTGIMIGN